MSTTLVHRRNAVLLDARGLSLAGLAGYAWHTLRLWQQRAAMRRHLQRLDDRLLADMGMTREDVHLETSKPFWRA